MGGNIIEGLVPKIDQLAVNGLTGVENSLAYEVSEVENHIHNRERWMAAAAVPAGETHIADPVTDSQTSFQVDGGNDTWGPWVQMLGSSDTPVTVGMTMFDLRRLLIVSHERNNNVYLLQIAFGASGAAALAAGTYTEMSLVTGGGTTEVGPVELIGRRQDAASKGWVRTWAVGQNTGTLDFLIGLHEYPG